MMSQFGQDPRTLDDILRSLQRMRDEELSYWDRLTPERFVEPFGDAWSPADHVRHLTKSTRPVAKALSLPGLALRGLFGLATAPSTSLAELRERYRAALAAGAKAGAFAPSPVEPPSDAAAWQKELMEKCRQSVSDLREASSGWSESDLDSYRIPHPALGKLTLREMLFFTLIHYAHHRDNVARRLADITAPVS